MRSITGKTRAEILFIYYHYELMSNTMGVFIEPK